MGLINLHAHTCIHTYTCIHAHTYIKQVVYNVYIKQTCVESFVISKNSLRSPTFGDILQEIISYGFSYNRTLSYFSPSAQTYPLTLDSLQSCFATLSFSSGGWSKNSLQTLKAALAYNMYINTISYAFECLDLDLDYIHGQTAQLIRPGAEPKNLQ